MADSDVALSALRRTLLDGQVIPAHPLALTASRRLDERRQAALTRYYCDAGAGAARRNCPGIPAARALGGPKGASPPRIPPPGMERWASSSPSWTWGAA